MRDHAESERKMESISNLISLSDKCREWIKAFDYCFLTVTALQSLVSCRIFCRHLLMFNYQEMILADIGIVMHKRIQLNMNVTLTNNNDNHDDNNNSNYDHHLQ